MGAELDQISAALDATRILLDTLRNQDFATEEEATAAPRAASAVIQLAICRIDAVIRAASGCDDPRRVWASHNDRGGTTNDRDGHTIILREWPTARRLKQAEEEVARLKKQLQTGTKGRPHERA